MREGSSPRKRVAVIGDGALDRDDPKFTLAYEIGRGLMDAEFAVVTGGLGGVMEASARGARESRRWTHGSIIALLPGCDPADANAYSDVIVPTGLDHVRNALVVQSDAVIAVGGGAGTLAEIAFAWIYYRPIVALRVPGWSGRLAEQRIDERVRYPDIPEDRVYGADTALEAVTLVTQLVDRYSRRHHGIARRRSPTPHQP